jgi:hypothetical protein
MPTHDQTAGTPKVSYEELRKAGRSLIPKLYEGPLGQEYDIMKAARKLTVPVSDRTLLFDGETDMNALADFWIHEYRHRGKTLIERCRPDELDLTPLEADLLLAHQRSRTSLFEVVETQPLEQQVRVRDLLEPGRAEVRLMDVHLSASLAAARCPPLLLFFRLVTVQGYEVTSGVSFVFLRVHKPALLAAYRERMNRVLPGDWSERKFVFFYRKHQEIGEEQMYADVTGTA